MKKRRVEKLNRIERAIISLAGHIERCPMNQYKVRAEILEILGYEEFFPAPKKPAKKRKRCIVGNLGKCINCEK